jgi:hypothetical protein
MLSTVRSHRYKNDTSKTYWFTHCLKMVVHNRNTAYNYTPYERVFLCIVTEFIEISLHHFTVTLGWIVTSASAVTVQATLSYRTCQHNIAVDYVSVAPGY